MPLRDLLLGLFVIAIWALNIIVIKVGVAELPPLLMTTLRFMLVAVLLVPFYPVARVQLPFLLLLSITFGSLHFALLFIGLEHAEAGTGALLVQMGTPFATLLAGGVTAVDQAWPAHCADGVGRLGGAVRGASGRVGVMAI